MITNNSIIDDAYNQLSNAYYVKRDRKAIEESCKYCQSLGIPKLQELAVPKASDPQIIISETFI